MAKDSKPAKVVSKKASDATGTGKFKAVCQCGASNAADDEDQAITYIIHKDGCRVDLANWKEFITVH